MAIPNYMALLKRYELLSEQVRNHFQYLPELINKSFPYEIALAYTFLKIEQAQNRILYGGVVKTHRGDAEFAKRVVHYQHLKRETFKEIYANIFGHPMKDTIANKLNRAEKTRDKVIHGKIINDSECRESIADAIEYADLLNSEVSKIAGFAPFGNMKGFKGRADSLDKQTTRWLMKGLGFSVK